MKIYLVQHAEAVPKDENANRPLTKKGAEDVDRMADFLGSMKLQVENVFHSGKTRAVQTAEGLAMTMDVTGKFEKLDGMGGDDDVVAFRDEMPASVSGDTMLVGHQPFMGKLASLLLTGSDDIVPVEFQKGCVVCLGRGDKDTWRLEWMLTPAIFG